MYVKLLLLQRKKFPSKYERKTKEKFVLNRLHKWQIFLSYFFLSAFFPPHFLKSKESLKDFLAIFPNLLDTRGKKLDENLRPSAVVTSQAKDRHPRAREPHNSSPPLGPFLSRGGCAEWGSSRKPCIVFLFLFLFWLNNWVFVFLFFLV